LNSVEVRILFHSWSKEIYFLLVALLTTCEIKFDLPPKSTNILYVIVSKGFKFQLDEAIYVGDMSSCCIGLGAV